MVEEARPYLHNHWVVANAQHQRHAAARLIQATDQIAWVNVIAAGPQCCIDITRCWRAALGLTVVCGTLYFGGTPQEMALRNIRRFAEEVMPAFEVR